MPEQEKPEMRKEVIVREDGRTFTFYWFRPDPLPPRESGKTPDVESNQ